MASNSFGTLFRITTFGESHGKAVGVVIDGCPPLLPLCEEEINEALTRRAPGRNPFTSPRLEEDRVEILSGLFEGKTTGAPICLIIANKDADSAPYNAVKDLLKPGHANYTYQRKYGIFDHRGGGRASARETACRVAAGKIAEKLLQKEGIETLAFLSQVGAIKAKIQALDLPALRKATYDSLFFCPDPVSDPLFADYIQTLKKEQDSTGGIVSFLATGLPPGLGDPVYEKLEAKLAFAMMSLPASKGFEIGEGFASASFRGSTHNDLFDLDEGGNVTLKTNHAGGTLGGISTGMPLWGNVAFKPTSSIQQPQETVTMRGEKTLFHLPPSSRHDPCVAIRAVPVVQAMLNLVLVDSLLFNRRLT